MRSYTSFGCLTGRMSGWGKRARQSKKKGNRCQHASTYTLVVVGRLRLGRAVSSVGPKEPDWVWGLPQSSMIACFIATLQRDLLRLIPSLHPLPPPLPQLHPSTLHPKVLSPLLPPVNQPDSVHVVSGLMHAGVMLCDRHQMHQIIVATAKLLTC
jgi:hypothetical protein